MRAPTPWLQPCRFGWVVLALLVVIVPLFAPMPGAGQEGPDPRPEGEVYFYDENGLFSEDERATLARDAELLQSTEIPILVYVRVVPPADASLSQSQAFADQLRREWEVESAPGADDGLVLLFTWVPQDPLASTAVMSYGEHTFDGSGLTPEDIEETIATSVASLIEQEEPFEALVYLMRETRYTGIYSPPAPSPLSGTAAATQDLLRWAAPLIAIAAIATFAVLTRRFWVVRPRQRVVRTIVGIGLAVCALLWTVSVYARSEIGIASTFVILLSLGLAAWTWSRLRFTRHGGRVVRRRAVPSTHRLMRKRHQARAMLANESGGRQ